jgi:dGTPase
MGNPPFGHSGERAIRSYFSEGKGSRLRHYRTEDGDGLSEEVWNDIINFDGNANAFRLLTHQFVGRRKGGFVMTYSTLASIVKYPYCSAQAGKKSKFGFFTEEQPDFCRIADALGMKRLDTLDGKVRYARHPLVYLVEAADDICYEIMDIEDAHKLKILTTAETKELLLSYFSEKDKNAILKRMNTVEDANEQIVYLRSCVINTLENECVRVFIENEEKILAGKFEGSLIQSISEIPRNAYNECVKVSFARIYNSKDVMDIEIAGFKVITTLTDLMVQAVIHPNKAFSELLINRVSTQYNIKADTLYGRIMAVLDYISGMTDVYAMDMYRKINGMSIPTL